MAAKKQTATAKAVWRTRIEESHIAGDRSWIMRRVTPGINPALLTLNVKDPLITHRCIPLRLHYHLGASWNIRVKPLLNTIKHQADSIINHVLVLLSYNLTILLNLFD